MKRYFIVAALLLAAFRVQASLDAPVVETPEVLEKEAAFGDSTAQYHLGRLYLEGTAVTKDPQKALGWFRKAAAGLALAQYDLAAMLANGTDVPKDDKEAARWFYAAAQNGVFEAQLAMIEFYATGRGVGKSPATALAWDMLARRTLQLRTGLDAGLPPKPAGVRADGAVDAPPSASVPPVPQPPTMPTGMRQSTNGNEDPTAFALKPDLGPMIERLTEIEKGAHNFEGATEADYQRSIASAKAYLIPLPQVPQKPTAAPAWLREKTITQSTLHESPLLPIPDDRSSKVPFGPYGTEVIKLQPWKHAESEHFIVHFVGEAEAKLTMQYIEGVYTVLTQLFNLDPQRAGAKSHVFIFPEAAWRSFETSKGLPPQVAGFAFRTELLLGASTTRQDKPEATKVICHEVTHVLVSRYYPGQHAPLWLNEGLAEYIALRTMRTKGALAPAKATGETASADRMGLRGNAEARLLGKPDPKIDVDQLFARVRYGSRTSPDRLSAFYANSQKAVATLFEKLPVEGFSRFFNLIVAGNEPGISLATAYGKQCDGTAAFAAILNGQ